MEKNTKIVIGAIVIVLALVFIFGLDMTGNPIYRKWTRTPQVPAFGSPGSDIVPVQCTDTDNGMNFRVKGTCMGSRTDSCNGYTLTEWFCQNNACKSINYVCGTGANASACLNGACV